MKVAAVCLPMVLVSMLLAAVGATAQTPPEPQASDGATTYAALMGVRFDSSQGLLVQDLRLERGPAIFYLGRGTWIPLSPVGGRVTGAYFVGEGRLLFEPPEGVERDQLEKFTESRVLDEPFTSLYLRFTDGTADAVTDGISHDARGKETDRAQDQHSDIREHLLEKRRINLEARLLVDLVEDRQDTFFAWIETSEHGLLAFQQDPTAPDLYTLATWNKRYGGILDTWCAFGPGDRVSAHVPHYTLSMTLDGEELVEGRSETHLAPTGPGVRALSFDLHPLVDLRQVLDENGEQLFFAREKESRKEFEGSVTVVFPEALPTQGITQITFVFGGDIIDTVGMTGREYGLKAPVNWYPSLGYLSRSTYEATFRVDPDHLVFASGELVSDKVEGKVRVLRFKQDFPVALFSFNYGDMPIEMVEIEGLPPITVFGRGSGLGSSVLRDVGIDVGNSLGLFEQIFGEYPFPYMYVTRIPYRHGQGFPGLLHLWAGTFFGDVKGASEAFRAHETAHQWWGHIVGWKTYRDQWLSEGFAEYSGAVYAAFYHDDSSLLDRMLEAWRHDIFTRGNLRASLGFDRFGLPKELMKFSDGTWAGPISLGRRLSSSLSPIDYNLLVYEKGAYVLHMIRMMMRDFSAGGDAPFTAMMQEFVATHRGGEASTEDFRRVVEKHMGADMGWFFDQWVYGTAVPTYRYAWRSERGPEGQLVVKLRVRQRVEPDVPFKMLVPVRFEFAGGRTTVSKIPVQRPEQVFTFELPSQLELEDLVLNHANAVLATVEKEKW